MARRFLVFVSCILTVVPSFAETVKWDFYGKYAAVQSQRVGTLHQFVRSLGMPKATEKPILIYLKKKKLAQAKVPKMRMDKNLLIVGGLKVDFKNLGDGKIIVNNKTVKAAGKSFETLIKDITTSVNMPITSQSDFLNILFPKAYALPIWPAIGVAAAIAAVGALVASGFAEYQACKTGVDKIAGFKCYFGSDEGMIKKFTSNFRVFKFECKDKKVSRFSYDVTKESNVGVSPHTVDFEYDASGELSALVTNTCKYAIGKDEATLVNSIFAGRKVTKTEGPYCEDLVGSPYEDVDLYVPVDRLNGCCASPKCYAAIQKILVPETLPPQIGRLPEGDDDTAPIPDDEDLDVGVDAEE